MQQNEKMQQTNNIRELTKIIIRLQIIPFLAESFQNLTSINHIH